MIKRNDFLPFCKPCHDEDEITAVTNVIKSGWWTKGNVTKEFERILEGAK